MCHSQWTGRSTYLFLTHRCYPHVIPPLYTHVLYPYLECQIFIYQCILCPPISPLRAQSTSIRAFYILDSRMYPSFFGSLPNCLLISIGGTSLLPRLLWASCGGECTHASPCRLPPTVWLFTMHNLVLNSFPPFCCGSDPCILEANRRGLDLPACRLHLVPFSRCQEPSRRRRGQGQG